MTGIELALQKLAMAVAKNGFEKIYKTVKSGSAAKRAIELIDDVDLFEIESGIKNLIKERAEKRRIEKLNKESLDIGEAFLKEAASVNSFSGPTLSVANKRSVAKSKTKKKGKK